MTDDLQWEFLNSQALAASVIASLQRVVVYAPNVSESERATFRKSLKEKLVDVATCYGSEVSSDNHISNIVEIVEWSGKHYGHVLRGGALGFGPAQKALNLYLKFLWCHGRIPEPPHCPFDSLVISKLPIRDQVPWTKLTYAWEYRALVDAARMKAGSESLARWELREYQGASL